MALIGVTGYARSGKTSVGMVLESMGWERRAFADPIKAIAYESNMTVRRLVDLNGWEKAKKLADIRQYLQDLGLSARKHLGEDVWIRAALKDLPEKCVITDVRFPNEVEAIRGLGGQIVKVIRPGVKPANGHISETGVDKLPWDHLLSNGGTLDDLARDVRRLAL